MARRRIKKTQRALQRDHQKYSNHRLMKIYARNNDEIIKRRIKHANNIRHTHKHTRPLDPLRRWQNIRAALFSPPLPRLKRPIRNIIKDIKLLNTRPIRDLICANRKARKIMMFIKGNVGHGTSGKRRKMTLTSKVRC